MLEKSDYTFHMWWEVIPSLQYVRFHHCYGVLPSVVSLILLYPLQNNVANLAADFSAIKELDSLSNEIVELQK